MSIIMKRKHNLINYKFNDKENKKPITNNKEKVDNLIYKISDDKTDKIILDKLKNDLQNYNYDILVIIFFEILKFRVYEYNHNEETYDINKKKEQINEIYIYMKLVRMKIKENSSNNKLLLERYSEKYISYIFIWSKYYTDIHIYKIIRYYPPTLEKFL